MADCARRDCTNDDACEVRWLQPNAPPNGPEQLIGMVLCRDRADEIEAKLCEREGCLSATPAVATAPRLPSVRWRWSHLQLLSR
jgi:hypothetical protein